MAPACRLANASAGASAAGIVASGGRCVARSARRGSRQAGGAARRGRSGSGGWPRLLQAGSGPSSQGRSSAAASRVATASSSMRRRAASTLRDGGVGPERDDRLQLGVEDHLAGEPVLADPPPARERHQQRPAEPSEGGGRSGGERRVAEHHAGASQRLCGHGLREPRPPGHRPAREGEAVLPVGRVAAVDGAGEQRGREPPRGAAPLLQDLIVERCEAQQGVELVAGAPVVPEHDGRRPARGAHRGRRRARCAPRPAIPAPGSTRTTAR